MQNKHTYAYGHSLHFKLSNPNKDDITIVEDKEASLDTYSYEIHFDTNQGREIYLCSPYQLNKNANKWAFVVSECVSFFCDITNLQIRYKKELNYSDLLMEYWLIHIVIPLFFTIEGRYYFLHTGTVAVDEKAVLFLGDSFSGKSTLTNFFLQEGHKLISDDKLATFYDSNKETFFGHASHAYHRPYRAKEDLGQRAPLFEEKCYEIAFMFWLKPVSAEQEVVIRELKGVKKFECLRYSTEMDILLHSKERFEYLGRLANSIKLYEIEIPHDLKRLPEVYTKILKHIKG